MTKPRLFSGIQPTGSLHLGNYIGAISQWLKLQNDYEAFFCIVDLHAITLPQDPQKLPLKIKELAALYLACGLDPDQATVFIQSHNPDHANLTWILNCLTTMGQLERMTQYKAKSNQHVTSVGLFNYPVLMAADILLYQTDIVPVGEDQKQHVELTRDLAEKFNRHYGETFKLPQPKILTHGARIMSLKDPHQKMSKSDQDNKGTIDLLDSPDSIITKIGASMTDSETIIKIDPLNKPGITNLLTIFASVTDQEIESIEKKYQSKTYQQLKTDLSSAIIEFLTPIQARYQKIIADEEELMKILHHGQEKAEAISGPTLKNAYQKLGLR
jgi:tryptophanyl-tRNA synthetase